MSFLQRFILLTAIAAVIGLAALGRGRRTTSLGSRTPPTGAVTLSLATVMAALLVVGVVSDTKLRHVVQVAPLALALGLLRWRPEWGVAATAPLLSFWLLVMGAIWLFLFGLARIVNGRFTPVEIALTIVIGGAAIWGLVASYQRGTASPAPLRAVLIAAFALLQFAAMWLQTLAVVSSR